MCGDGKDKEGKGKDGDWGKHKEKIKKCMEETDKLIECCPFPKNDEVKEDPDCKHHLEGVEKKEKKDQMKASSCFTECVFKKNELLNDKNELDNEKLKNAIGDYLEKNNGADFKKISLESIDYCINDCKKSQATSEN